LPRGVGKPCRLNLVGVTALGAGAPGGCNPEKRQPPRAKNGEGAALFLLSREPAAVALVGAGESADAYHLSAPEPTGTAPEAAMRQALAEAGATPRDIRYVNLHATATQKNDEMESRVM